MRGWVSWSGEPDQAWQGGWVQNGHFPSDVIMQSILKVQNSLLQNYINGNRLKLNSDKLVPTLGLSKPILENLCFLGF